MCHVLEYLKCRTKTKVEDIEDLFRMLFFISHKLEGKKTESGILKV